VTRLPLSCERVRSLVDEASLERASA
jgi:hypothetical protein